MGLSTDGPLDSPALSDRGVLGVLRSTIHIQQEGCLRRGICAPGAGSRVPRAPLDPWLELLQLLLPLFPLLDADCRAASADRVARVRVHDPLQGHDAHIQAAGRQSHIRLDRVRTHHRCRRPVLTARPQVRLHFFLFELNYINKAMYFDM